jgi:hypothetical protein
MEKMFDEEKKKKKAYLPGDCKLPLNQAQILLIT